MNQLRSVHRIDFHLHSFASNVTDYYAANRFSIPESYSDPFVLYRDLRARGMSLVTITDHNSIDGVLRLLDAGLPDVFISAEMTATFPEDGCNIHVTVANMTEAQFREVDRLRTNVYEMIDYVDREIANESDSLRGNRVAYFMTHPLMSTQNRPYGREGSLTVEHIEKLFLLLNTFEVRNGTRTRSLNEFTHALIASLDRTSIERLANKHGIIPKGPTPWLKATVGGSDDHSGINPGQTWTEFDLEPGQHPTANALIDSIRRRGTRPGGSHGGPVTLAHAMLKLLYDGSIQNDRKQSRPVGISGPIHALLRLAFDEGETRLHRRLALGGQSLMHRVRARLIRRRGRNRFTSFEQLLAHEAHSLLRDPRFMSGFSDRRTDDKIFHIISGLVNKVFIHYLDRLRKARSVDIVSVIKEIVSLVSSNLFVSLPYFLSYFHQSSDRLIIRDVHRAFSIREKSKLVLVTDTLFDVNGVARTIRRMAREASRRGIDFTIVTCLDPAERSAHAADPEIAAMLENGSLVIFESLASIDLPQYDGLKLRFPPFLEMLKFIQESGFTKMQISTPGTVGIAGVLSAKLLQIETSSTYHTCFPEYVENYTNDVSLEALAWKYMVMFYHSVDEVVVPSKFIAKLLHARGLRKRKLLVLDRWVDTEAFCPSRRIAGFWEQYGVIDEHRLVKFVYVGRLGVEKNLSVLAQAFRRLAESRFDVHLCIIGDGPYRAELEKSLRGLPVTFTGFLGGDRLASAIASCDVKLFPSTTDTWGNAPLEAQAAGLPVVVSDTGGPQELMIDGVTGFRVRGRDVISLYESLVLLMDPEVRQRMGEAARRFTVANRIDEPFSAILDSEAFRSRAKLEQRATRDSDASEDDTPEILVFQGAESHEFAGKLSD